MGGCQQHLKTIIWCCVLLSFSRAGETSKSSSIDRVRLELLRELWDEPVSYGESGSNIPAEWKIMFQPLIDSNDVENIKDNEKREKILDHVSVRSSILLNYLPSNVAWVERRSNVSVSHLANYRVVFDETWNREFDSHLTNEEANTQNTNDIHDIFNGAQSCLTVGRIAHQLQHTLFGTDYVSGESQTSSPRKRTGEGSEAITSSHQDRMTKLKASSTEWPSTIVVVKDISSGVATILDGNHRAVLWVAREMAQLEHDNEEECLSMLNNLNRYVEMVTFEGHIDNVKDENDEKVWKFWRDCP